MIVAMLLALAAPNAGTGVESIKDPAERRAAKAVGAWMGCLAPLVADKRFPKRSEADAAADAALQACGNEEAAVRSAVAESTPKRVDKLMADMRGQFRTQVRHGSIRRKKS
jgi:hypothetical protein